MKKIIVWMGLAAMGFLGAENAVAQIMLTQPVSVILKKIKSDGYIAVRKIQLINGEYQAQALDNEGEPVDLWINSHSGDTIALRKTDSHLPMLEVVEKIEAVGYADISLIAVKNSYYEIVAIGPNGQKTLLNVDAITGVITTKPLPYQL